MAISVLSRGSARLWLFLYGPTSATICVEDVYHPLSCFPRALGPTFRNRHFSSDTKNQIICIHAHWHANPEAHVAVAVSSNTRETQTQNMFYILLFQEVLTQSETWTHYFEQNIVTQVNKPFICSMNVSSTLARHCARF